MNTRPKPPTGRRRLFTAGPIEFRKARAAPGKSGRRDKHGGSIGTISGYAAVWNSLSLDLGGFKERIRPGAFAKSLRDHPDKRALVDHESSQIIGRTTAGTLTLKEDAHGLRFSVDVADTTHGRNIVASVKRQDVTGASFSMTVDADEWRSVNGEEIRELIAVQLHEVSVVSFPAYTATSLSPRSGRRMPNNYRRRVAALTESTK